MRQRKFFAARGNLNTRAQNGAHWKIVGQSRTLFGIVAEREFLKKTV